VLVNGFASAQKNVGAGVMLKTSYAKEKYDEQRNTSALAKVMIIGDLFSRELSYEKKRSHCFTGSERAPGIGAHRLRNPQ
jgi:hypothetical protein